MRPTIAQVTQQEAPKPPQHTSADTPVYVDGIPIDITRHFGLDVFKIDESQKRHLKDIRNWIAEDLPEPTSGNIMERIGHIQRIIGLNGTSEQELLKIWNWLKIRNHINDLRKQQRSMENA